MAVTSALFAGIMSLYPDVIRNLVDSVIPHGGYYIVCGVLILASLCLVGTLGYEIYKWKLVKRKIIEPQILLHQHQYLGITPIPIVKFDFEIRSGEKRMEALEVQVAHDYDFPKKFPMSGWPNLDLRQYDASEAEKGKCGDPVRRISLLIHDIRRFTLITFLIEGPDKRRAMMRTTDPDKPVTFGDIGWMLPLPHIIYARFVGLAKEVEKRYLIVYNRPPWGRDSKTGWSNDPVELVEVDSARGKQLLAKLESVMK